MTDVDLKISTSTNDATQSHAEAARVANSTPARDLPTFALGAQASSHDAPRVRSEAADETRVRPQLEPASLQEIYRESVAGRSALGRAISLINQAVVHLEQGQEAARQDDHLILDNEMMLLRPVVDELFCCRRVGDGFGMAVNAARIAVHHLDGSLPTEAQVGALRLHFERLRSTVNPTAYDASLLVERLAESGLQVEPPGLENLFQP